MEGRVRVEMGIRSGGRNIESIRQTSRKDHVSQLFWYLFGNWRRIPVHNQIKEISSSSHPRYGTFLDELIESLPWRLNTRHGVWILYKHRVQGVQIYLINQTQLHRPTDMNKN